MESMDLLRQRLDDLEVGAREAISFLEARIVYLETRESNRDRNTLEPGNVVEVGKPVPACTPDMKKKYNEDSKGDPEEQDGGI